MTARGLATGIGSMPGTDDRDYSEAVRVVLGELPELLFVPEVPGRGAIAGMIGRSLAMLEGLAADLQPAGWRLTSSSGVDYRRAVSLLAQDLDQVEEQLEGYTGALKTQVAGPWTLASSVEKTRGDRLLSDHGARRELAQSLAEGMRAQIAGLKRRVPGVDRLIVQVDEPTLPAVLAGQIPTASGFGRHRSVDLPEASAALEWVFAAISEAGAEPWLHSCAADMPWLVLHKAGAVGLSADLSVLAAADLDALAEASEASARVVLGVVPALDPTTDPGDRAITERVSRACDLMGVDPTAVTITPSCGLAGSTPRWARRALALSQQTAQNLR